MALLLSSCSDPGQPPLEISGLIEPADPGASPAVPKRQKRLDSYAHRIPVMPADWKRLNGKVSPNRETQQ